MQKGDNIQFNTFTKGLNLENDPLFQPEGTYRHALNVTNVGQDSQTFALTYERSNKLVETALPDNFQLIGYAQVEDTIVLFLYNPLVPASQIGIIDSTDVYTRVAPSTNFTNELNFSLDFPIKAVGRRRLTNELAVYWTDNYNPVRFLNITDYLENPIPDADLATSTSLIPSTSFPEINEEQVLETGSLNAGVYQLAVRYKDANLTPTSIINISSPISINDEPVSNGFEKYDGDSVNTLCSKSIVYDITNIDTTFDYIDLIAVFYEGESNTPRSRVVSTQQIDGKELTFTLSSVGGDDAFDIPVEEITREPITYDKAKAIEQKDNTLFLANLSSSNSDNFNSLQQLANKLKVNYVIKEQVYPDVPPGFSNLTPFFPLSLEYDNIDNEGATEDIDTTAAETNDSVNITITFNEDINSFPVDDDIAVKVRDDANNTFWVVPTGSSSTNNFINGTSITPIEKDFINKSFVGNTINFTIRLLAQTDDKVSISSTSGNLDAFEDRNQEGDNEVYLIVEDINGNRVNQAVDFELGSSVSIDDNAGFGGYKDLLETAQGKGYRRGEVYSLGFGVIYSDGTKSPVFHIPADDVTNLGSGIVENANTITKRLGTYVSSEKYPAGQNYIGNDASNYDDSTSAVDNRIRHHVMPTLQQEPHFVNNGGVLSIRILGLEFDFNGESLADYIEVSKIQGVYFARERRNTTQNKSILSQGMFAYHCETDTFSSIPSDRDSFTLWTGPDNTRFIADPLDGITTPSTGSTEPTQYVRCGMANRLRINSAQGETSGGISGFNRSSVYKFNYRDVDKTLLGFVSPETILAEGQYLDENAVSAIRAELDLDCTNPISNTDNKTLESPSSAVYRKIYVSKQTAFSCFLAYDNINPTNPTGEEQLTDISYVDYNSVRDYGSLSNNKKIRNQDGVLGHHRYLLLKTTNNFLDNEVGRIEAKLEAFRANLARGVVFNTRDNINFTTSAVTNRLCNLINQVSNQYGAITDSSYVTIDTLLDTNPNTHVVYNGDTFIGRFAYTDRLILPAKGLKSEIWTDTLVTIRTKHSYPSATEENNHAFGLIERGLDFRSVRYFFVESDINVDLRHEFTPEPEEGVDLNVLSYYPKNTNYIEVARQGLEANSYNTQYSFQNTLKNKFSRALSEDAIVDRFITRIIYSIPSTFDAISDNYRTFLQENYTDLPSDKGQIWNLFVHANYLYAHTPKTLWRTSANERAFMAGQDDTPESVVLGNSGLFNNPAREMLDLSGGYAGTVSQFGGINTPMGYFFYDKLQGRAFLLTNQLKDISTGISRFLSDKADTVNDYDNYIDNPYIGNGVVSGFDPDYRRLLLTDSAENFTLSYSLLTQKWISFHSYIPKAYVTRNNIMHTFSNNNQAEFYLHNIDESDTDIVGIFYGNKEKLELELVVNKIQAITKTFDNQIFILHSEDSILPEFFGQGQFITINQDSGIIDFVNTRTRGDWIRFREVNNEYRFAFPREGDSNRRLKGKYLRCILNYSGSNKLSILSSLSKFRVNHR